MDRRLLTSESAKAEAKLPPQMHSYGQRRQIQESFKAVQRRCERSKR